MGGRGTVGFQAPSHWSNLVYDWAAVGEAMAMAKTLFGGEPSSSNTPSFHHCCAGGCSHFGGWWPLLAALLLVALLWPCLAHGAVALAFGAP